MTKLHLVGDLILDAPDPGRYFEPSREALAEPDVLIGQVEIPHTLGGEEISTDVASPPTDPANLRALGDVGFHVATLAGNHIADRGAQGVRDTLDALHALGIATSGAGMDLTEARRAAIAPGNDHSVATLSVNCVGPDVSKATSQKPGAAFLDVHTVYGRPFGGPGGAPMSTATFADRTQLRSLEAQISDAAAANDIVVVALHKGILHLPAVIAEYELELAHAAIDAGADIVVGHHAHILKGIEVYRGKPIFHGLGNFVTVTSAISESSDNSPERRAWARRRRAMTGFDPNPAMPLYPFHPESRNTMIATAELTGDGWRAGFIPCWIDDDARPVPVTGKAGEKVVDYVRWATREGGFETQIDWDGTVASVQLTP